MTYNKAHTNANISMKKKTTTLNRCGLLNSETKHFIAAVRFLKSLEFILIYTQNYNCLLVVRTTRTHSARSIPVHIQRASMKYANTHGTAMLGRWCSGMQADCATTRFS